MTTIYNYNGLWKLLIDKGMSKTELRIAAGFGAPALAKLGKNQPVSMETISKICKTLNCKIEDIVCLKEAVK